MIRFSSINMEGERACAQKNPNGSLRHPGPQGTKLSAEGSGKNVTTVSPTNRDTSKPPGSEMSSPWIKVEVAAN
jgi:hypothetical protein